jgi:hypothetical protein
MNDEVSEPLSVETLEDWLFAALLRMVLEHCARPEGTLDSYTRWANAEAMRLLAEAEFIRIDADTGDRILATALPKAAAFLAWMEKGSHDE